MKKLELKGEDWMMTEADVKRFVERVMPVLEKHGLSEGAIIDVAIEGTWEMDVYIPMSIFSWPTIRKRMKAVCEELGYGMDVLKSCDHYMTYNSDRSVKYHCFCMTNMYAPKDVEERYREYDERERAKVTAPPPPPERFSEPWRSGHSTDKDGTIYDEGVILPKQDPRASDTAIISLPAEFLVYHQDEKGFGEIRDYTPYYAKKFLTRPIRKVKILYGHQAKRSPKNKWVLWALDKIEVELDGGEIYTSPYREDGTLKTRADYGSDLPITSFHLSGHKQLAGTTEKATF